MEDADVIDCRCPNVRDRPHTSKQAVSVAHAVNPDVLPTIEDYGAKITTALSHDRCASCVQSDRHPYQLCFQCVGVEHRTARVKHTQSIGFVECLNRIRPAGPFCVGRKKFCDERPADRVSYPVTQQYQEAVTGLEHELKDAGQRLQ